MYRLSGNLGASTSWKRKGVSRPVGISFTVLLSIYDLFHDSVTVFISFLVWPFLSTHFLCRGLLLHLITLKSHTLLTTTRYEGLARRRDLYLTPHNPHKWQTFMPPVDFEPAIPASERSQTHSLDGPATGIGDSVTLSAYIPLNHRFISEWWIRRRGRKWSWPNLVTSRAFVWEDWGKSPETSE
jgi:hypothetical protein